MTSTDHRSESASRGTKTRLPPAVARVAPRHAISPTTLQWRVAEAISDPDFVAVALFCAIGLLATANLILRIPDIPFI